MASLLSLYDTFTGNILPFLWTSFATGTAAISQSGGQVTATPPSATAGSNYAGYDSKSTVLDLTNAAAAIQVVQVCSTATNAQVYMKVVKDSNNYLQILEQNGTISFQKIVGGSTTTLSSTTYDSTNHAWWRIREAGGTVFWETSPNGLNQWTTQTSTADPFVITAMSVEFAAGTFQSETSPGSAIFDNFNVPGGIVQGTTTSTSSTSVSSTSASTSSTSTSSTSSSISTTSASSSTSSTSTSISITTVSTSSTSTSISTTSISSTSSSTSISSTSSSISSTSTSSTSISSTSSSTSISSTSSSISSTSSSISSTSQSTSSTSFSSTSSSSSTSTTTLPPPYITYTYETDGIYAVVKQFGPADPTTWICPAGVTSVLAECWGGGGGGGGDDGTTGGGGGGGGAYSNRTVAVTAGTSYTVTVGTGGPGNANADGSAGGDSWFSSTGTVLAKGGSGGKEGVSSAGGAGGQGGLAGSGVGDVTNSGGTGGAGGSTGGGGGGGGAGGAGSNGPGATGGAASAGTGGSGGQNGGQGGTGGAGGGTATAGARGKIIGGAGGASGSGGGTGGAGASGLVKLTYTVNNPPTTSANLQVTDTAVQYSNEAGDDGDYSIQTGTQYIDSNYKRMWTNNTDTPSFTWKGRTSYDTRISPMLFQIFNQNSGAWETLATVNTQPPDVDFQVTVTQSANVGNYYDSTNTVLFRNYQRII